MRKHSNHYKRIISLLLTLMMVISCIPAVSASETEASVPELLTESAQSEDAQKAETPPASEPLGESVGEEEPPAVEPTAAPTPLPEPTAAPTPVPIALTGLTVANGPDQVSYWEGEAFDPSGMVVAALYSDGTEKIVTDYSYSPSGALTAADSAITIQYEEGGVTEIVTQPITVKAVALTGIKITKAPTKTSYFTDQKFSKSGMVVTAYYNNGTSKAVTNYSVTPASYLKTTDKTATVSYKEGAVTKTAAQKITVKAAVLTSIKVNQPPKKLSYVVGQKFDKTGMTVTAYYNSGTKKVITGYTVSPAGALKLTDRSVKLSYKAGSVTKTVTVAIQVKALALSSLKITTAPKKVSYVAGQKFSTSGMVVTAYFNNGVKKNITNYSYTPTAALKTTDKGVTISYKYGSVTKKVVQPIVVAPVTLTSIKVTTPPKKTSYLSGEKFSTAGMVVTAYFNNGTKKTVTKYTYNLTGTLKATDKAVTIRYKEGSTTKTVSQAIKVLGLTSLKITKAPSKIKYVQGQKFSKTGMVVTAYFSDGTKKNITNYSYTPTGALKTTDKGITISYKHGNITKKVVQPITVSPITLTSIKVSTPPKKTSYVAGEKFSTAGMVVTAYFNNGTKKIVTKYTCTPSGGLKATDKAVTISYKEGAVTKTVTQAVKVLELKEIKITKAPTKLSYVEGQKFSKTGMTVVAYFSDGSKKTITDYSYSPAGALKPTYKGITVSYKFGLVTAKASQPITVKARALSSIKITAAPKKTAYAVGEKFSKSGMVVTAYWNDSSKKVITDYTYAPAGGLKVSDTAVTLSYTEKDITKTVKQAIKVTELTSLKVTKAPTKTAYFVGEKFSKTGMTVTAYYHDGSKKTITNYSCSPAGALKATDKAVTISYKEGSVTKTVKQTISVKTVALSSIKITTPPKKTKYKEYENFSKTGMVVKAYYNNGTSKTISSYSVSGGGQQIIDGKCYNVYSVNRKTKYDITIQSEVADKYIVLSYKDGSVTKTAKQKISIEEVYITDCPAIWYDAVGGVFTTEAEAEEYVDDYGYAAYQQGYYFYDITKVTYSNGFKIYIATWHYNEDDYTYSEWVPTYRHWVDIGAV